MTGQDIQKLHQENQQLKTQLQRIREQLQKLKRIPSTGLPEHVTQGPEFTGYWSMLPLFNRSILRGVLGLKSEAVIEVLDELYRNADLPISH